MVRRAAERGARRERSRAAAGHGPLLQRDYWAVIEACALQPTEFGALLARRFAEFAPAELARFAPTCEHDGGLGVGDELVVQIRMARECGVRVLHTDANSLTLCTLRGHPEAGRITFGAYRDAHGHVVFHIRSRARSGTVAHHAGFLAIGEPMQTNTWTAFIDRVAHTVGRGVRGRIHVETRSIDPREDDEDQPTYVAEGA